MHRTILSLMLFFALCLSSCVGGKAIERSYFSIQYVLGETDRLKGIQKIPHKLQVNRFSAAIAYDRQEIVYRSDPHEFRYYWYKLWAAKPEKLVREQVLTHLRHIDLFEEVGGRVTDRRPHFEGRCVGRARLRDGEAHSAQLRCWGLVVVCLTTTQQCRAPQQP